MTRILAPILVASAVLTTGAFAQQQFGTGCAGASGVTPTLAVSGAIKSGESWTLEVTAPGGLGFGYLLIGFSNTSASALGGLPLPMDLGTLFADPLWSECALNVDPSYALQPYAFDPNTDGGLAQFTFPGWDVGDVYLQAVNIDPDFVTRIAGVSLGLELRRTPVPRLVSIPAGSFAMGSNAPTGSPYFGQSNEKPIHTVTISSPLWMSTHEVTQAEYTAVMGSNPSSFVGANRPVESVTWSDAVAYCAALTASESLAGNLPVDHVYRLPTEAEWEYACRAGTTTEFNVGDALFCDQAQFLLSLHSGAPCGSFGTADVGSHAPNAWGLHDMHGNVWEWCLDSIDDYSAASVTDPVGSGPIPVIRGGSWLFHSSICRSAFRGATGEGTVRNDIGFRVVLAPVLRGGSGEPPRRPPVTGLVALQPGTFEMGSNAGSGAPYFGGTNTQPVHTVSISYPFWMGRHEVTQAEYAAAIGSNPSSFVGADRPVDTVSWNDALAYCAALTATESLAGNVPVGYEYRLPTEAEWEYACRAGSSTEFNVGAELLCDQAKFWYSNHSDSSCNSSGTTNVGSYAPNAWDLHDMHGNVWEWCLDSFAAYSAGAVVDPFVTGGSGRVIRGGSWSGDSSTCRSARRSVVAPTSTSSNIGFRVVLAPILVP